MASSPFPTRLDGDGVKVCPDCRYVPPSEHDDDCPGRPIRQHWDEVHRADCPRVAFSRETRERLEAFCREADECRGRAAVEARTYWIG